MALDARSAVGLADILLITLDTLRFDVADAAMRAGETPVLRRALGDWERRHTPGSFTFAAHASFFAGFLPTPESPGRHERLFALAFEGSETIGPHTAVLDAPDIVSGLRARGYDTLCAGGTGFFNEATHLGSVLPRLFDERRWCPEFGVTNPRSTEHQVAWLIDALARRSRDRRVLAFLNVSALHQPNHHHLPGATVDSPASQRAALRYVDRCLEPLFSAMQARGPVLAIVTSDHGTAYGEDGHVGHRIGHPVVWTVPYGEALWPSI